jgi:hypothetical protein
LAHLHYRVWNYLLAVISLHVLAVMFYYGYKRQNLIFPMITGKHKSETMADAELHIAPTWRLAVGALIVSGIVWLITTGFYF